jgi:carboxymethylenebutenolidase
MALPLSVTPTGVAIRPVQFPGDGVTMQGVFTTPVSQPKYGSPAIVLLHEWWGLTLQTQQTALRFADAGFAVLAPNLYSRQGYAVTRDPHKAAALMASLSSQWAARDLNSATRFLRAQPLVDPMRAGMVGFSMGGILALNLAGHNSDLKAFSVFYAKMPPVESAPYLVAPVQIHHAGKDTWVTRKEVDAFTAAMDQHGKSHELRVYPDAAHGFFNDSQPDAYDANCAALAWERTLQFLRRYLQ